MFNLFILSDGRLGHVILHIGFLNYRRAVSQGIDPSGELLITKRSFLSYLSQTQQN